MVVSWGSRPRWYRDTWAVICVYSEVEESVHLGACLGVPRPVCVQAGGEVWLVRARAAHQAAAVGPVVPAADMASVQPEPEEVLQEQVVLLACRRYQVIL